MINDNYNSSFYFTPGKTYRLRVINMAGFATFYFDIDGHDLDIIEVDGVSNSPNTDKLFVMTPTFSTCRSTLNGALLTVST